jgi:hypothetical protein
MLNVTTPRTLAILALSLLFLVGCGGSNRSFVANPSSFEGISTENVNGKLFLGAPMSGVPVEMQSLDGSVLSTRTTDASGNFVFSGSHPTDFRLLARLSDGSTYSREVRGFASDTFAVINLPTTMVSLLDQAQPGQTLSDVEGRVRQGLGLPNGSGLDLIEDSVGFAFSHLAFYVRASEAGGVEAYLQEIADTGVLPPGRFLLRQDVLDAPLVGLAPELASVLESFRADPRVRLSA